MRTSHGGSRLKGIGRLDVRSLGSLVSDLRVNESATYVLVSQLLAS